MNIDLTVSKFMFEALSSNVLHRLPKLILSYIMSANGQECLNILECYALTYPTVARSKLAIETLEQCVKDVQS